MFTWRVVAKGEGRAAEGQSGDQGSKCGPGELGVAGSWEVRLDSLLRMGLLTHPPPLARWRSWGPSEL